MEVGRTLLQVQYVPRDAKAVEDIDDETGESLDKLIQAIEDADDTLKVWTTADA